MGTFRGLMRGPEQSRRSRRLIALAGLVLGGFAALLGTVTHSGGIDGGITGLVVALLSVTLGSAGFTLFAGAPGWLCFGAGFLATLVWTAMRPAGDAIGALSPELSSWWFYGGPVAIPAGGLLAWLGFAAVSRVRLAPEGEPYDVE